MNVKRTVGITLGALALGAGLLGAGYARSQTGRQSPTYTSSIQVEQRTGEKARLSALVKIDAAHAIAAALAQVPGTPLAVELDNEHGNVVYSVEVKTASHEIHEVTVDAGTGQVLQVSAGGEEEDAKD
jgi:uncharacterized membrane protein YkoI